MRAGWLLCVLAVLGVGCDSTGKKGEAPEPSARRADSPAAAPSPESKAPESYRVVTKRIQEKQTTPAYEIEMEYPALEGARMHTSWGNFNRMIADTVALVVAGFKSDQASLTPFEGDEGLGSSLHSRFEISSETPELVSLLVSFDTYLAGAAHPSSWLWAVTYDLANDRFVALQHLFLPNSGYLDTISKKSIEKLTAELGENADLEMLRSGAAAEEGNFRNFTLGRDSLLIDFDEYQVGPYAIGRPRVAIAYNALSTILAPDGPVARLRAAR